MMQERPQLGTAWAMSSQGEMASQSPPPGELGAGVMGPEDAGSVELGMTGGTEGSSETTSLEGALGGGPLEGGSLGSGSLGTGGLLGAGALVMGGSEGTALGAAFTHPQTEAPALMADSI